MTTGAQNVRIRIAFPELQSMANPPKIEVSEGVNYAGACAQRVEKLGSKRPYVMVSHTIATKSQYLQKLQAALPNLAGTWIGMKPHSPFDYLIPIIEEIRALNVDCIISLGGGSIADAAKLIACCIPAGIRSVEDIEAMARSAKAPWEGADMFELDDIVHNVNIPLIFIPTTLSAAEYTPYAGCTNPINHTKYQFHHPGMAASLIILDPILTVDVPMGSWLSTGVRSIDHCTEGICSLKAEPAVTSMLCRGLKLLFLGLIGCHKDPRDLDARTNCQAGSNLAIGQLLAGIMAGASHGIGHMLGPVGNVPHGETSCILLPTVMKYNAPANADKQEIVKSVLWDEPELSQLLERRGLSRSTSDAGDALKELFKELGLPTTLSEKHFDMSKLETLAEVSLKDLFLQTNPIPISTKEEVLKILNMCI